MRFIITISLFLVPIFSNAQWTSNSSPTYPELINYYQQLDKQHQEIELYAMGESDTQFPIYVCIINGANDSLQTFEKARNSTTILINNAIHAGEPDGVNACLIWIDQWIKNGKKTSDIPVIAIIPAYNVGGMVNRGSMSRANQDGPAEYGFRGNAQNLDLNRDFIKLDSKNAKTFTKIYQSINPDVFVDTHVSNGADYQYTLTLISSMKERLAPSVKSLTYNSFLPAITKTLEQKYTTDLFPYVELIDDIPEKGIQAFNDLPRYAMGYASLFHSLSFTVETHMLKPFPNRVEVTRQFLNELFLWSKQHTIEIEKSRNEAIAWADELKSIPIQYELSKKADSLLFKGFESGYKPSLVTNLPRLYYDRKQPFEKNVPYFGTHRATDNVQIPSAYIVDGSAVEIIERLKLNGIIMDNMGDQIREVTTLTISDYDSGKRPYEGHFLHTKTKVEEEKDSVSIHAGSYYIPTNQLNRMYLISVLEPKAEDSFFAWNFLDSHLQQKEYFSPYVFEEKAVEILAKDKQLAQDFAEKRKSDTTFAANSWEQLLYIYKRSSYFEKSTYNRLPVYKIYE